MQACYINPSKKKKLTTHSKLKTGIKPSVILMDLASE